MARVFRSFRGVLVVLLGFFVLVGLTAAITVARIGNPPADARFRSMDEVLERYPHREANATALRLESLTAAIGIDTATRQFEGRARPEEGAVPDIEAVAEALFVWTRAHIHSERRAIEPPPAVVSAYLDRHAAEISAIRELLIGGSAPQWELQLARLAEAPYPNLIGHRKLQNVLMGQALLDEQAGRHAEAGRWLEASWQLNEAIREDPMILTSQFALGQQRMMLGVLRQMSAPPAAWARRLATADYRTPFENAVAVELALIPEVFIAEVADKPGFTGKLTRFYMSLCVKHARNRYLRSLRNLSRIDDRCDANLPARGAGFDIELPFWNAFGKLMVITTDRGVQRVAQVELETELTSRLLELANRYERFGGWPLDLTGPEQSSACVDDRWIYDVDSDGTMTITLSRDPRWIDDRYVLPHRFVADR